MIVVDTNVMAYWLLPGEKTALAEQVREKDANWIAPPLWRSEFRNILAVFMRQDRISLAEARQVMVQIESVMTHQVSDVASESVLQLVDGSHCSAYDCEFVALAQQFQVRLVTADQRILREFPQTAVSLRQFVDNG